MDAPEQKQVDAQTVISIHHEGKFDDLPGLFGKLAQWAQQKGVQIAGPAIGVFLSTPEGEAHGFGEYEACLPIAGMAQGDDEVTVKTLPGCTVASTVVTGGYDEMTQRYTELYAWLSADGLAAVDAPREIYLKHPGSGPNGVADPKDAETEIQIPIED